MAMSVSFNDLSSSQLPSPSSWMFGMRVWSFEICASEKRLKTSNISAGRPTDGMPAKVRSLQLKVSIERGERLVARAACSSCCIAKGSGLKKASMATETISDMARLEENPHRTGGGWRRQQRHQQQASTSAMNLTSKAPSISFMAAAPPCGAKIRRLTLARYLLNISVIQS